MILPAFVLSKAEVLIGSPFGEPIAVDAFVLFTFLVLTFNLLPLNCANLQLFFVAILPSSSSSSTGFTRRYYIAHFQGVSYPLVMDGLSQWYLHTKHLFLSI